MRAPFLWLAVAGLPCFVGAQQLDRSKRPTLPARTPIVFPAVHERALANGLTVRVVENHALPLVAVRVAIAGGSLLDPDGKDGLFTLDTLLVRDGTSAMNGAALSLAIDELGAPLSPTRFTTVTPSFDSSLALVGDMLVHPTFPADAIDRRKAAILAGLQRAEALASTPGLRAFNAIVFGPSHPFARRTTSATLDAITRDDIVAFHARHVRPQNVTITIVGDVTERSAVASVERVFGTWQRTGERTHIVVPAPAEAKPTTIYLLDRPGSPQSTIFLGQSGPLRSTRDFYALEALGALFGGPTGSRLTLALRENRPLTYAVSHYPMWRRASDPSSIFGSSNVNAARTDSALVVWLGELRDLATTRMPDEKELAFARSVTVGSLATRIETIDEIANRLNTAALAELPASYYNDYIAGIDRVTTRDLADAARRYIDPSHTAIVIVGDRKVIETPLRAAGIAPLVILPPDH